MNNDDWKGKKPEDLTLEDALNACEEGLCFVCADGKFKHISFERRLKNAR